MRENNKRDAILNTKLTSSNRKYNIWLQSVGIRLIIINTHTHIHTHMKSLIETTTGHISSRMILEPCGDCAGKFQDEAFELISKKTELTPLEANQWCDIMYDARGNIFAVWADDSLICHNADVKLVQLDVIDVNKALEKMAGKYNWE